MGEILFSKKIKCANCNKNFKGKKQRGKRIYVCSSYDNGVGDCDREAIYESELVELLTRRYGGDFKVSGESVRKTVEKIVVKDKWNIKIDLKNDKPIVYSDSFIQF